MLRVTYVKKTARRPLDLIPMAMSVVQAGFPSPAEDYLENSLNLHDLVVQHPAATFYVRVSGDSMREAGIHSGDLLVVDRSLEPGDGKIVVAVINGEFTVKRLKMGPRGILLAAENASYPDLSISPDSDFQIWGVVTYVIHRAR